jgi:hypothetical protein
MRRDGVAVWRRDIQMFLPFWGRAWDVHFISLDSTRWRATDMLGKDSQWMFPFGSIGTAIDPGENVGGKRIERKI